MTHNGEPGFLNDGNVAWVESVQDIGPGRLALDTFEQIFRVAREHEGHAVWSPSKPVAVSEFAATDSGDLAGNDTNYRGS